jgi:hypothetical protein
MSSAWFIIHVRAVEKDPDDNDMLDDIVILTC